MTLPAAPEPTTQTLVVYGKTLLWNGPAYPATLLPARSVIQVTRHCRLVLESAANRLVRFPSSALSLREEVTISLRLIARVLWAVTVRLITKESFASSEA